MSAIDVKVPPIGDFKDVPVVQVLVKAGDTVKAEDPLITLESDKATIDIPTPKSGTVREVRVKVGDRVSEGREVILLDAAATAPRPVASVAPRPPPVVLEPPPVPDAVAVAARGEPGPASVSEASAAPGVAGERAGAIAPVAATAVAPVDEAGFRAAHASPSVRRFAREVGADLGRVSGTGPKGRILKEDVERFVRQALEEKARPGAGGGLELLPWPQVDFARHGPVEVTPLSRIKRLSAANLARNWVMIPHVTQHDEADVTELEALRVRLNQEAAGPKLTLLAFVMKACVAALQRFPALNASLQGEALVLKRYFNFGFAADTPQGLVVPVVKGVDTKGVRALAEETAALAEKARQGKVGPQELSGGTFSISSLGGIGGTAFTPIINAPEVAILGLSRTVMKPVWDGTAFAPRLMLPLSLSYDHRVIDGAEAARFTRALGELLGDLRRALL